MNKLSSKLSSCAFLDTENQTRIGTIEKNVGPSTGFRRVNVT